MAPLLALASSLLWGGADFLGGRATRRWGVLQVLAWSQLAALVTIWAVVAALHGAGMLEVTGRSIVVGAVGGVAGVVGLAAFYEALARGPMALVPPIAATGVFVPVVVGLAEGDDRQPATILGIVIAVVGVVVASVGDGAHDSGTRRISPGTLGLGLVAAAGFGIVFVALDAATTGQARSALVVTAGVRSGSLAVIAFALVATMLRPAARAARRRRPAPCELPSLAGIGLLDSGANVAFAAAAASGSLEVVAVLGSLYPAVTSALAHVVLGERLGRIQLLGVVLAVAGVLVVAGTGG